MQTNGTGKGPSVFTVMRALRRRKAFILIPVLLLTPAVVVYSLRLPERYRSRALVAAETAIAQEYLKTGPQAASGTVNVQEQMFLVREALLSRPVLETVIRELNLYPTEEGRVPDQAIAEMKSHVDIQVEGPDAFYISFQGDNPQQVMQAANRLAELFIERTSDRRGERVTEAATFLESEVERLRKQLDQQEESLKGYKRRVVHELPEYMTTNLKLMENLQQEIQSKTNKITEDQARRSAVLEEMRALEKEGTLESTEPVELEKSPAEITLEEMRQKLRQLKARYTPKHPEVVRMEKEVRDFEATVPKVTRSPRRRSDPSPAHMRYLTLKGELEAIEQRLKSYEQERRSLMAKMGTYEGRIHSSPQHERTLAQLMRDSELTRAQYEGLLAKQQEAKLDQRLEKSHQGVAFKILERAPLPSAPYSPQRHRIILMGFLASLGLGLISVLAVEQMDTSFDTVEDFQGFTNLPVLSLIPRIPAERLRNGSHRNGKHTLGAIVPLKSKNEIVVADLRKHFHKHHLVTLSDPESVAAEQYGILALKVRHWMEQTGARVLAVTSSAGGEGKSVTALNLSVALSSSLQGGVVLLDGDLRRPRVHEYLGLKVTKGLSELLSEADDNIYEHTWKVQDLCVIPGGSCPRNPLGLLASRRTHEVLARLKEDFRFVVLDTPPIVPIADSHVLASLADGVAIVVRARQTRRELLQRATESLGANNVLGVVLNDIEYKHTRYGYAYRYYQKHYLDRR